MKNHFIIKRRMEIIIIQDADEIKKIAMDLDNTIETKDIEKILPFFADDCEIFILEAKLFGLEGARKWLEWMLAHVAEIKFDPIVIMVKDNIFFEEFIVKATLQNGTKVESKWAEVLVYENLKIRSLRLYFDRLEFADSITKGPFSKFIIRKIIKESLKGLV